MNSIQRGRLIQLIKQHFPYTEPCDVDHALQWEIIGETLNALGPSQTTDQWIEEWKSIKHSVEEKFRAIKSKDSDPDQHMDLKLSEEDHRVIKICGLEDDTDKMAELVKILDCRAVSPFQNESPEESDNKDEGVSLTRKDEADECKNNIGEINVDRNVALEQLTEQKKINDQLTELLEILKMPSQNIDNSK